MMQRHRYTTPQIKFLAEGYKQWRVPELTRRFNEQYGTELTESQIQSTLKNYHIKSGRSRGVASGSSRLFTPEQVEFIKRNYKKYDHKKVAEMINLCYGLEITANQMRCFVHNHGIKGRGNICFKKGHKPWNTGMKGVMKANSGSFKKGHNGHPALRKPIGHERICSKDGFILIKVSETNPYTGASTRYKYKQRHIWEQYNGSIPQGMVVAFIDGNKLNCDISNLELISQAENVRRNQMGLSDAPPEMRDTIRAAAKLKTMAFEKQKEQAGTE